MEKFKKPSILITLVYTFVYYLLIVLWPTNLLGIGLIAILGPLIAITFIGIASYHIKEKEEKRFWLILCLALFSQFIGEIIWRYHQFVLNEYNPFPGWDNLFYAMFSIIYSIAVIYKIFTKKVKYRTIQLFFNSFIFMTVLTTISWVYFLKPFLHNSEISTFKLIISVTYPVAILGVMFSIALLFFFNKGIFSPKIIFLNGIAMIIYTIVDCFWLFYSITSTFDLLSPLNPVWNFCLLLIGISSFYSVKMKDNLSQEKKEHEKPFYRLFNILPYFSLLIFIILGMTKKEDYSSFVIGGAFILLFIVIRQVITIFENESLVRQLKIRTEELEMTQLELIELKNIAEKQSWIKTKIAEIATMHSGIADLNSLANLFISKVTPMVEGSYGVFYIKNEEGTERLFQKVAAYAYNQQNIGAESFRLGEGLVGQCALENRMILLDRVPENYIKITSGVGKASPSAILIIPVKFEGEVLAVIELASFKSFNTEEQMLLKELMDNLGVNINSILRNMQFKKLLQESQALTEELQSHSEELQLQQEELKTVNEQLEVQIEQSEQKTKEVEQVQSILEEKAQQLAISSQYKSEFLANMSHELRTPLNSLLILAQLLAENAHGNLTSKQVNYAETIFSSGNDLLHLINDILDIAKVEAGKMEININEVLLSDVKDFVEAQFTPVARKKNIEFNILLDSNLPKSIHTDKQRLQQILKNLLSNAFKFTDHGSVSFIIEKVKKESLTNLQTLTHLDIELAFSVKDTGIGIPAEKQGTIFDAFKQADGTISRKYGGTGLGLSISREISHLLGGFIEVESTVGQGSIFSLFLPNQNNINTNRLSLAEAEIATGLFEDSSSATSAPSVTRLQDGEPWIGLLERRELLEGRKILLVDDDIRNIFALSSALESYQVEVLFAENGEEGIAILQSNPDIELILMDIMMPKMDGFQTIQFIRQIPEFNNLPIIALTAKAMKYDRDQCIDAGASDYISKPVIMEQLLSIMHVWLYK
ncbi:response regulator [Peribacillus sp. JNUCC 23]